MATAEFELLATCARGLEQVLGRELLRLGIRKPRRTTGGVWFRGGWEELYRANLWLRCAERVLLKLSRFQARDPDELYRGVREIDWSRYLTAELTLAVHAGLRGAPFRHSGYVALKIKDAIVDRLRADLGRRPDVDRDDPDVRIEAFLAGDQCTICLDSSGRPLHERGYRRRAGRAPLKESLAAGLVQLSGWRPPRPLLDPFCGSGTILIEAALLARNMAPGLLRQQFGFQRWPEQQPALWERVREQALRERREPLATPLRGLDRNPSMVEAAGINARAAGIAEDLRLEHGDARRLPDIEPGTLLLCNPPYGERQGAPRALERLASAFGRRLRALRVAEAWIFSANPEFIRLLGGAPARLFRLYNGPLRASLVQLGFGGRGGRRTRRPSV